MAHNRVLDPTREIIASKLASDNKYGQNGYQGASSDLPGQHTCIKGFGPEVTVPGDVTKAFGETSNWQTRAVEAKPYPVSHGMKDASANSVKVDKSIGIDHQRNRAK